MKAVSTCKTTLEDLTISIDSRRRTSITTSTKSWQNVYDPKIWKDLDGLALIPTLKKVIIRPIHKHHETIPKEFQEGIQKSLLLLEEKGKLAFGFYNGRCRSPLEEMGMSL
jgi:hypothetical protein